MGIIAGPSIVDDESLIFHYDMNNERSFVGQPSSNILTTQADAAALNTYTEPGQMTVTTSQVAEPRFGGRTALVNTVTSVTANLSNYRQIYSTSRTMTANLPYSVSCWIHTTVPFNAGIQVIKNGSPFTGYLPSYYEVLKPGWNYISTSGSYGSTVTDARFQLWLGLAPVDCVYKIIDPMFEQTTAPTKWLDDGETRSNTQAIVDLTSNETVTANSVTYNSDGTFRFGNGQYITLPNAATTFGTGSVSTSVEFWIRPINDINTTRISVGHLNVSDQRFYIGIGNSYWDVGWGNFAWNNGFTGTRPTADYDIYQHICVTINAGVVSLYKNGVKSTFSKTDTTVNQSGVFPIGTFFSGGSPNEPYYGIDDIPIFRIYNKTLTDAEVKQNYESQKGRFL